MKTEITINESEIRKALQCQWNLVANLEKREAPDSMIEAAVEKFCACCSMMRDLTGIRYDVEDGKIIIVE
jgi:hypothetical protein